MHVNEIEIIKKLRTTEKSGNQSHQLEKMLKISKNLSLRGFAKKKKFKKSEITMEVGGWVQVSRNFFFEKSSQNSPKPVIIFWSNTMCIVSVYALLKVVGIMI